VIEYNPWEGQKTTTTILYVSVGNILTKWVVCSLSVCYAKGSLACLEVIRRLLMYYDFALNLTDLGAWTANERVMAKNIITF